ncbi:AMP-dependent synthetase/ligase [Trinorchestia longiramus]|nr:AMP-dependent synthetase/ligase [Trinorchestia longiramus]
MCHALQSTRVAGRGNLGLGTGCHVIRSYDAFKPTTINNEFEQKEDIIPYPAGPRISSGYVGSNNNSIHSSADSKILGGHASINKHKVIPDIKPRNAALARTTASKSVSGHRNPDIPLAFGTRAPVPPKERTETEYNRRQKFVNKKLGARDKPSKMAPNPRSQSHEDGSAVISGHKIALNVRYDGENSSEKPLEHYNQNSRIGSPQGSNGAHADVTPVVIDETPALRELDEVIASAQRSSNSSPFKADDDSFEKTSVKEKPSSADKLAEEPATKIVDPITSPVQADNQSDERPQSGDSTQDSSTAEQETSETERAENENQTLSPAHSEENFVDAAEDLDNPKAEVEKVTHVDVSSKENDEENFAEHIVVCEREASGVVVTESVHQSAASLGELRSSSPLSLDDEQNSTHSSSTVSVPGQNLDSTAQVSETLLSSAPETENFAENSKANMVQAREEFLDGPDQVIPAPSNKTWIPSGAVKLHIADEGLASHKPISVPSLLRKTAEKYPNQAALVEKRNNEWVAMNYSTYYKQVRIAAKGFIKLGLDAYHGVCILGFNSSEWFISDLGAIFAGGFAAGIYTTNSPEACQHCALNCEAQIFVVEDQKQLDKVLKIRPNLPSLKAIIQYKGTPTTEGVFSWDQFMEIGRKEEETALEGRLKRICVNQCCTLIYTSGTTGAPKGVMLSHDNIVFTALSVSVMMKMNPGTEVVVSYLPLSHVAAQLADIFMTMINAGTAYFAQPDALKGSLVNTLKEVRPTAFLGVPRVWEKIYERMMDVGRKTKGLKKSIATWAKSLGLEANDRKQNADFSKPVGFSVANAIVFKKIKQVLGLDRCKIFLSGAAPISPDVVRYFHSLNICVLEIYGMSESTGPHTSGIETAFKVGSAGRTIPGCQTKIDKPDAEGNGEVCMTGRNVAMGYLLKEDATNDTIDDEGWLHSGDIGKIDEKGFLFITGRLKELIITAGGENIPPVLIEDALKSELNCISNAMLIGDKRKFLSVLLTLKTDMNMETGEALDTLSPACIEWCQEVGSNARTIYDVLSGPDAKIMRAIQDGIDRTNKMAASNAQKVQKWTILPRDFTVIGDELGPTMKLKRPVVAKKYAETIERFYE